MDNKLFAIRLRKALDLRQMRPIDLAKKSGINKATISEYLKGKYVAKQRNVYELSKALDINPAWLLGYEVDINNSWVDNRDSILYEYISILSISETEKELLTKSSMLDEENQKKVLKTVNKYLKEQGDYCEQDQNGKWILK